MKTNNPETIPSSEVKRVTRTFHGKQRTILWRGLNLTIKRLLPPSEVLALIAECIARCEKDDEFYPGLLDLSYRVGIISHYAYIELPNNIDELNFVIYETDLFDQVCSNINKDQLAAIRDAIGLQH